MSRQHLRVACLQLSPGEDLEENIAVTVELAKRAADAGAELIVTPEYTALLHASGRVMRQGSYGEAANPALMAFQALARSLSTPVLLGSLTIVLDDGRLANRCYYINGEGDVVARYDKLHMFDATLPSGRTIRESTSYRAGDAAVVVSTPWGRFGLSICYDLRFPQLYRALAQTGCRVLFVPSAFTQSTGARHWHALLRARAIENASFVVAAATCGTHPGGHQTYGHSLVIGPDGGVLAEGGTTPDCIVVDLDLDRCDTLRQAIPSLTHDRDFSITFY